MTQKELTKGWTPRSGGDEVGGYVWLPRMLDKARRTMQGDANHYLALEDSYMDRQLLDHWRIKGEQVREWIRAGEDDAAIAARVANHTGEDEAARRAWSEGFRHKYGVVITVLDATEGRVPPGVQGQVLETVGKTATKLYDAYQVAKPWQIAAGVAGIVVGGLLAVLVTSAIRDPNR